MTCSYGEQILKEMRCIFINLMGYGLVIVGSVNGMLWHVIVGILMVDISPSIIKRGSKKLYKWHKRWKV